MIIGKVTSQLGATMEAGLDCPNSHKTTQLYYYFSIFSFCFLFIVQYKHPRNDRSRAADVDLGYIQLRSQSNLPTSTTTSMLSIKIRHT